MLLVETVTQKCECSGTWCMDTKWSYDIGHVYIMVLVCNNSDCGQEMVWGVL